MKILNVPIALAAMLTGLPSLASDLSFSYLDFGGLELQSSLDASQLAGLQTVQIETGSGDGLWVSGSLQIGNQFHLAASYQSAVVDVDALVISPLITVPVTGNFDWVDTRTTFGWHRPIGERLDLLAELSHHSRQFDFGSFATENFDTSDSGAELGLGFRFNPQPAFELAFRALASSVADVDMQTGDFSQGTRTMTELRWYVYDDLGLGLTVNTGDIDSLALTVRFGFGDFGAGG